MNLLSSPTKRQGNSFISAQLVNITSQGDTHTKLPGSMDAGSLGQSPNNSAQTVQGVLVVTFHNVNAAESE